MPKLIQPKEWFREELGERSTFDLCEIVKGNAPGNVVAGNRIEKATTLGPSA
jgi:hypothetical protein